MRKEAEEKDSRWTKSRNYLKRKTMKLSVREGAFASVMNGFGDSYINPLCSCPER